MPDQIRMPLFGALLALALVVWLLGRRGRARRQPVSVDLLQFTGLRPLGSAAAHLADRVLMTMLTTVASSRPGQVRLRRRDRTVEAREDAERTGEFPSILARMKQDGVELDPGTTAVLTATSTPEVRALALMEMADPCPHCGRVECIDNRCLPQWGPLPVSELPKPPVSEPLRPLPVPAVRLAPGQSLVFRGTEALEHIRRLYDDAEAAHPVPEWSSPGGWPA